MTKFRFLKSAKASLDAHGIVEYLNQLLTLDPEAINTLVQSRVECNEKLTNSPYVPVYENQLGVLGLLNGVLSKSGEPHVVGIWDNSKLIRFQILEEPEEE